MRLIVGKRTFLLRFEHYADWDAKRKRAYWVTECGLMRDGEAVAWMAARCSRLDLGRGRGRRGTPKHLAIVNGEVKYEPAVPPVFTRENRRIGREIAVGRALKAAYPNDRTERRALLAAYHAALHHGPQDVENAYAGARRPQRERG